MRIVKEHSAALIIDMQERLFPHLFESEKLIKNTSILIQGLKILNIPIFVTEQYVKGLGSTISPIAELITGIKRTEKTAFSCWR